MSEIEIKAVPDQEPEDDVLFIEDLARLLRCSPSTIARRLRDRRGLPPQMASPDDRPRWYRDTVLEWMRTTKTTHQFRAATRGLR